MGGTTLAGEPGRQTFRFGETLRQLRQDAGLSQVALAQRSGVAERTISNLERGLSKAPQPETLRMLLAAFADDPVAVELLRVAAGRSRPKPVATLSGRAVREARHPLLGREAELAELAGLAGDGRVVTLCGPGGAGKSRLALEAAAIAARQGRPVHLVALEALASPEAVVPAVAQALDAGAEATPEAAASALEDGGLLLLDDADRLHAAGPAIAALAAAAPRATVLVTSREPLGVPGELALILGPLPAPAPVPDAGGAPDWAGLLANPAVALFVERAAEAGRQVAPEELTAVAGIVRALDGLPLAIELAAAQAPFLSPPAILDLLGRTGGAMLSRPGAQAGVPDRQRTMAGAIAWSADLLPTDAKALLPVLGAFRGGVGSGALAEVLAGIGEPGLLSGLPALVRAALVHQTDGADRFAMLEPVRFYAEERLEADPRRDAIRLAHARAFAAWARRIGEQVRGPLLDRVLADEELDRANALAAARWATAAGELDVAAAIAAPLAWPLESRSLIVLLRDLIEPLADRAGEIADPGLREQIRTRGAIVARIFGSRDAMARRLRALQDAADADPAARPMALVMEALLGLPGSRDPIALLREAREPLVAASDPRLRYVDMMLGLELGRAGQPEEGLALLQATLADLERAGDLIDQPTAIEHAAMLLNDLGRLAESRALLRRGIALCREHRLDEFLQDLLAAWAEAAGRDEDPDLMRAGAMLKGAMRAYAARAGVPMQPWRLERNEVTREHISARLGAEAFEEHVARGRALSLQQAADLAMAPEAAPVAVPA